MTKNLQRMAFIPELESRVALEEDWGCSIFNEYRNSGISEADGHGKISFSIGDGKSFYDRTFPAGSEFLVKRIYVRSGATEYSSVTLAVVNTTDRNISKLKKGNKLYCRFWVKLEDFNNAKFLIKQDKTISKTPTEHANKPVTLGRYKKTKSANYYVKFVHPDPELCFAGKVSGFRNTKKFLGERCPDLVAAGWAEKITTQTHNDSLFPFVSRTVNYYSYTPKKIFSTTIPDDWEENHKTEKYRVEKLSNWMKYQKYFCYDHPLNDEIFIPTDKAERVKLGLLTDKSELIDVPLAGGKLSIFDIELR